MNLKEARQLEREDRVLVDGESCFGVSYRKVGYFQGVEEGLVVVQFDGQATCPAFAPEAVTAVQYGEVRR